MPADGEHLAGIVQLVLQGDWAPGGAGDVQDLALGAPHPVSKLHHVGDGGRQQDEVDVRRQHDDDLQRQWTQMDTVYVMMTMAPGSTVGLKEQRQSFHTQGVNRGRRDEFDMGVQHGDDLHNQATELWDIAAQQAMLAAQHDGTQG